MDRIKLYFAHSHFHKREYRTLIEKRVEEETSIDLFNPLYDCPMESDPRKLVERDLVEVEKCVGVFSYIEDASFGTPMEIAYAKLKGKPVFIVAKRFCDDPWLRAHATKIFVTLNEFIQWANEEIREAIDHFEPNQIEFARL